MCQDPGTYGPKPTGRKPTFKIELLNSNQNEFYLLLYCKWIYVGNLVLILGFKIFFNLMTI